MQYFPSITFNVFSAEIFPWPVFLALYRYSLRGVANIWILAFISFITLHLFVFSVYKDLFINPEALRVAIAYINGPLLFWLVINDCVVAERLKKLIQPIFIFLVVLGLLQYSNLFNFLTPFMKFFTERALFEQFGGGRGVTLFATEPSRAGVELIFIYTFLSSYIYSSRLRPVIDILFMLFLIVCIK